MQALYRVNPDLRDPCQQSVSLSRRVFPSPIRPDSGPKPVPEAARARPRNHPRHRVGVFVIGGAYPGMTPRKWIPVFEQGQARAKKTREMRWRASRPKRPPERRRSRARLPQNRPPARACRPKPLENLRSKRRPPRFRPKSPPSQPPASRRQDDDLQIRRQTARKDARRRKGQPEKMMLSKAAVAKAAAKVESAKAKAGNGKEETADKDGESGARCAAAAARPLGCRRQEDDQGRQEARLRHL